MIMQSYRLAQHINNINPNLYGGRGKFAIKQFFCYSLKTAGARLQKLSGLLHIIWYTFWTSRTQAVATVTRFLTEVWLNIFVIAECPTIAGDWIQSVKPHFYVTLYFDGPPYIWYS